MDEPASRVDTVRAGLRYFVIVFAAGFVLGFVRVLWIAPHLGTRLAELVEAPIMIVVIIVAARHVVRRFHSAPTTAQRLATGGIALGIMIATEFTLVWWLQGLTPGEYVANRDPIAGTVYAVSLIVFAVMPLAVERSSPATRPP